MILSGTPIATIRHTPPISVNSTVSDGSASSAILDELLISSSIHIPQRPVVTIRSLSAATATPAVTIPELITATTEESNFNSTSLILNGNAPSAFRPIVPSTSSDSFVVTTLNSLISPSDHENGSNDRNHYHHHHHHHHQQQQPHQNGATMNSNYERNNLEEAIFIGLSSNTGGHDYETELRQARDFHTHQNYNEVRGRELVWAGEIRTVD
ncbi:unnamed protein product [Onchocerca flexuosa]|uniref:Uncharacterized protein n=1 Tax=Onchocerca flexuosa TaxID=387005 RepID=A0A183HDG8_9BILA|nr:unnamed protein product [Onchocerca flexuosa]